MKTPAEHLRSTWAAPISSCERSVIRCGVDELLAIGDTFASILSFGDFLPRPSQPRRSKSLAVAVNQFHAFAEGTTLPAPERLGYLPREHETYQLAEEIWAQFRQTANIADDVLLGADAWTINLTGDRSRLSIAAHSVVRGIIRVERDGHVNIADHCYIGDDVVLSAHVGIDIEPDVLITPRRPGIPQCHPSGRRASARPALPGHPSGRTVRRDYSGRANCDRTKRLDRHEQHHYAGRAHRRPQHCRSGVGGG